MQRTFGVLYQGGALWSSLTLAENVALPLEQYTNLAAKELMEIVSMKLALSLEGIRRILPFGDQRRNAQTSRPRQGHGA